MSTALVNHEIETTVKVEATAQQPAGARLVIDILTRCFASLQKIFTVKRAQKQLRVCESVSLGDKRFVAVIQVDQERFLIGGAANSVAMLTRLSETPSFPRTLKGISEAGPELQ
jgi:flagellar biogenesis protein FliO